MRFRPGVGFILKIKCVILNNLFVLQPKESNVAEVPTSTQAWTDTNEESLEQIDNTSTDKQKSEVLDPHPDPLNTNSDEENESNQVKQENILNDKNEDEEEEYISKVKHIPVSSTIKKKKFKFRRNRNSEQIVDLKKISTNVNENNAIVEDEFDIYGKYIASQLRKMDLRKALRIQLAIQNLVSEARISDMTNK